MLKYLSLIHEYCMLTCRIEDVDTLDALYACFFDAVSRRHKTEKGTLATG